MLKLVCSMDIKSTEFADQLIRELGLRDLLFVQRIAERKSLSMAAAEFSLTQPAASRWLRELEQLFRAHLFTRDRMVGMTPTPLGELVVQRGRALLADVSMLSSEIEAHRAGRGAHLQLGVIPYVSTELLEGLVSCLVSDYAMSVSVVEAATEPLMEGLRMQRLHAVMCRCSIQRLPDDLRQEVLFTQQACLLVHASVDISSDRVMDLSSFSGFRWVVPPNDSPSWHAIVVAFSIAKVTPPLPVLETASTKLVHALVAKNLDMIAVLPLDIGRDLEKLGGVRVLSFPAEFQMPSVGLVARARQWDQSHIWALRKALRTFAATGRVLRS